MVDRKTRVFSAILYLIALVSIQYFFVGDGFPINEKLLWLANGAASLILGDRLLNPHFTPPADVATNSFVAGSTLIAALATSPSQTADVVLIWTSFAACAICFVASAVVLLVKRPQGLETRQWVLTSERTVKAFGAPRVIFTTVILVMAWVFHREAATELFWILAAWTFIVAIKPIEAFVTFISWFQEHQQVDAKEIVGVVAAHQAPGLVLIRQNDDVRYKLGTLMAISDNQGPTTLGVALNYVGRDDGILLSALSLPVPSSLKSRADSAAIGSGAASLLHIDKDQRGEVRVLDRINSLCGIVDSDSSLEFIDIEVINDEGLAEGGLVDVKLRDNDVIYQIISGVTREDAVQQKNKYGYVRAKARKIGKWNDAARKFEPTEWLPRINAPVFLKPKGDLAHNPKAIGHFPNTSYEVSIKISEAVTHNTAILGILGIGKSYLSIELIERMISEEIKVIVLDLTDQYKKELTDFIDDGFQKNIFDFLNNAAANQKTTTERSEGGAIRPFEEAATKVITDFLSGETHQKIMIINPASFSVSKQTTNQFKLSDPVGFTDLSPCEITAIFSSAALSACQNLGMTDTARACLVYEEAHSLVPEWNSVASDGDKTATARSARAILQGRKFGLGCLLITQRTANVTKTILNQCNSIFAMRTFDDTGKEFLGNYIGSEYARILPTLKERHAVFFGKASSCDDPVLIRLNDREDFIKAFRNNSNKGSALD